MFKQIKMGDQTIESEDHIAFINIGQVDIQIEYNEGSANTVSIDGIPFPRLIAVVNSIDCLKPVCNGRFRAYGKMGSIDDLFTGQRMRFNELKHSLMNADIKFFGVISKDNDVEDVKSLLNNVRLTGLPVITFTELLESSSVMLLKTGDIVVANEVSHKANNIIINKIIDFSDE